METIEQAAIFSPTAGIRPQLIGHPHVLEIMSEAVARVDIDEAAAFDAAFVGDRPLALVHLSACLFPVRDPHADVVKARRVVDFAWRQIIEIVLQITRNRFDQFYLERPGPAKRNFDVARASAGH